MGSLRCRDDKIVVSVCWLEDLEFGILKFGILLCLWSFEWVPSVVGMTRLWGEFDCAELL